ncbi:protein archease-like [Anastrepha ludens]|uniref:protein archease-like n=1 Tax=Anastrepha ludens TaxID=28586 RepID=UPI0023AF2889|nr:protein archease-like [Anastrepha ludens]
MEVEFSKENFWLPETKYEYLDHTADVQLHAWGSTLQEAFEQCGMAMFGYMTELEYVSVKQCFRVEAKGDDIEGLLYHFLDELLFLFSIEPYIICRKLEITKLNLEDFEIECRCYGESFEIGKHPQGTEVKAITYSAMQVIQKPEENHFEVFVIIDI